MRIEISYTLCTDGDYSLRNAEEFGCISRKENNMENYDYAGTVKFENEDVWTCKHDAMEFLHKFLCNGLEVSYTHWWLLEDFYKIIESLEEVICAHEAGISGATRCIKGNYEGTVITVSMIGSADAK